MQRFLQKMKCSGYDKVVIKHPLETHGAGNYCIDIEAFSSMIRDGRCSDIKINRAADMLGGIIPGRQECPITCLEEAFVIEPFIDRPKQQYILGDGPAEACYLTYRAVFIAWYAMPEDSKPAQFSKLERIPGVITHITPNWDSHEYHNNGRYIDGIHGHDARLKFGKIVDIRAFPPIDAAAEFEVLPGLESAFRNSEHEPSLSGSTIVNASTWCGDRIQLVHDMTAACLEKFIYLPEYSWLIEQICELYRLSGSFSAPTFQLAMMEQTYFIPVGRLTSDLLKLGSTNLDERLQANVRKCAALLKPLLLASKARLLSECLAPTNTSIDEMRPILFLLLGKQDVLDDPAQLMTTLNKEEVIKALNALDERPFLGSLQRYYHGNLAAQEDASSTTPLLAVTETPVLRKQSTWSCFVIA